MKLLFEKATETEAVVVFTHDPIGTLIIEHHQWVENLRSPTLITITVEPGDTLRK